MNTNTIDWKSKLTSRKFWTAIAEFVTMLIIAFHGTEEVAAQVAAIIMAGAAVVAYIIGEGLADAAGAGKDPVILVHRLSDKGEDADDVLNLEDMSAADLEVFCADEGFGLPDDLPEDEEARKAALLEWVGKRLEV